MQAELERVTAERDTALLVAMEAMRLLTEEQFGQLRHTMDELDRESGCHGD